MFKLQGQFYDLKTDEEDWIRSSVGIRPQFQFNVQYHWNEHWGIHVSPYFNLNSVLTNPNSPIREQRSSFGLQSGIQYLF